MYIPWSSSHLATFKVTLRKHHANYADYNESERKKDMLAVEEKPNYNP